MGFDFLDPKDGVVIEILHTGGTGNVSVSGSVIGGGEISRREDLSLRKQYFLPVLFTAIFVLCYSGFALALARLSDVLFGEPSPWFIVPLFLMPAFLMPQVLPKLDALWSGGFMVKKLRDGYAKQEEALSVGKPPYTAVVDGEVKMGSIPTYSLALEHFGELCREYAWRERRHDRHGADPR